MKKKKKILNIDTRHIRIEREKIRNPNFTNMILLFDFTSAPNNDVTVAITGKNITVLIKRHTGHVSRFFSAFENPHPFVQHTTIIERPKRQVSFPTGHDLVPFQRMPLRAYHRVHRALQLTIVVH